MKNKIPFFGLLMAISVFLFTSCVQNKNSESEEEEPQTASRWTEEKANEWAQKHGWLVGCNYAPAYAINQLEFWQEETFDLDRIDKELGWAEDLGFNFIRVYLHDLLWEQDSTGFLGRVDQFLEVADGHGIKSMLVLFDGVWNPFPELGTQPEPKPHVHNSGWVQSPSNEVLKDSTQYGRLENYVKGVMTHLKKDDRVIVWDLYNEPDNDNGGRFPDGLNEEDKYKYAFQLLKKSFEWAREVNPSQPLTVGPWRRDWADEEEMDSMDRFMFDHSDVISFHSYDPLPVTKERVETLKRYHRPLICTEYMARPNGSTFESILPYFKEQQVAAVNWGFVDGKSQTIYPWDSWYEEYDGPPEVWFHDIFHYDGTPYDEKETDLIKELTEKE